MSISSPYILRSEASVTTSMFPVGNIASSKKDSELRNTLKLGWSNLFFIELMTRSKISKNIATNDTPCFL